MQQEPIDVLLVEDNPADARLLVESLRDSGPGPFRVTHVPRLNAAVEALTRAPAQVILLDLSLPDSTGLATVDRLQAAAPGVPIVVMTGLQDEALALQAVRQGVQDYLVKGQCEGELTARALRYAVERQRAEAALHDSEEQLRTITDAIPALISYVDKGGCYRLNNRAYETWFALDRGDVAGRHLSEVLGDAAWEKVRPRIERALAGEEVRFEDLLPYRGGGPRWVSVTYTPYRDPTGDVRGVVVLVNDISERKATEEVVRQSEERFSKAFRASPDGLVVSSAADGAIREVNDSFLGIFGLQRHEAIGRRSTELGLFVDPADRARVLDLLKRDGRVRDFEVGVRRRGGDVRTARISVEAMDVAGEPSILTIIRDITDRRRAEEARRESETRLSAVVGTAVDAIVTIDDRGIIDSANPATERLFGYSHDELVGRNVGMLMPEPYQAEHDGYIEDYLRTGSARVIGIGREVVGRRKDGSTFPLDLSVSEFSVRGRRMFTGIIHDITTRRRLEREILEASASEQRRIGHELHDGLCQQLTGAAFSAEILARKLQAKAPDAVPAARKLADEIDQAITQARTLARGLNPMEVHADALAAALDDLAGKISSTFGVTCRFLRRGDGEGVPGDNNTAATHLYRIAQEAISNAIRHGGAKKIEVTLRAEGGSLSLSVADDGKGFDPHDGAAAPQEKPAGIGLQTMSYRAKMISGILDVRPGRRGGVVVVTCSIPRGNGLVLR